MVLAKPSSSAPADIVFLPVIWMLSALSTVEDNFELFFTIQFGWITPTKLLLTPWINDIMSYLKECRFRTNFGAWCTSSEIIDIDRYQLAISVRSVT